jgi:colicin import membrane protein
MASAAAALRDPLLPRQPGGMAGGAALALAVHAALVVALAAAVNWRTRATEVVASAELWAALPQMAAPAPAAPPLPAPPAPPPVQSPAPAIAAPAPPPQETRARPDIALERERERTKERERIEREAAAARDKAKAADAAKAKAAAADTAKAAAAAEARLAAQRAENLRRMIGQAGGPTASSPNSVGSASRDAAPSSSYIAKLVATIRTNIVYTGSPPGNPTAEVEVRAGPSGTILSRRLVKPSGVAEWDEAVLRAVDRTAALPRDSDGRVPPVLLVAFRLRE